MSYLAVLDSLSVRIDWLMGGKLVDTSTPWVLWLAAQMVYADRKRQGLAVEESPEDMFRKYTIALK